MIGFPQPARKPDFEIIGYLRRWVIERSAVRSIYLHEILAPDPGHHMHNHPWEFTSTILSGGYVQTGGVSFFPGMQNQLDRHDYHSIVAVMPDTWTLVTTGPRMVQPWGFLVDGEHVPFTEHPQPELEIVTAPGYDRNGP